MSLFGAIAGATLKAVVSRRAAAFDAAAPAEAQAAVLRDLVSRARETRFGRDHRFAAIKTIEDFQAATPLRSYEAFWDAYWRDAWPTLVDVTWPGRIPFFALTSGTTAGPSKRIPVSREMIDANARAAQLTLAWHFRAQPASRLTEGVTLMLGGSTAFERPADGVAAGDLSGLAAVTQPWYARLLTAPGRADALMTNWDAKLDRLAEIAATERITGLTGTPSWTLVLLDAIRRRRPDRAATPLPDLALYVHGGMSIAPYAHRFAAAFGEAQPDFREVFPASEGFFAAADAAPEDGLRLLHDNGVFFEFVPLDALEDAAPPRRWLGTVETGVDYALVVSTNAGIWAYLVGDVVRFVSLDPPRLVVSGRTRWMLSAFGEHVLVSELEQAMAAAADAAGVDMAEFCAAPDMDTTPGRHVIVVELAPGQTLDPPGLDRFARTFDQTLGRLNDDYAAKRAGDVGLGPPEIRILPSGAVEAWMRRRGKLGGQHKAPRVVGTVDALPGGG